MLLLFLLFIILITLFIIQASFILFKQNLVNDTLPYTQLPLATGTPVGFVVGSNTSTIPWNQNYIFRMKFNVESGSFNQNNTLLQIVDKGRFYDFVIATFTYNDIATGIQVNSFYSPNIYPNPADPPAGTGGIVADIKSFVLEVTGTGATTVTRFVMNDYTSSSDSHVTIRSGDTAVTNNDFYSGYVDINPNNNTVKVVINKSNNVPLISSSYYSVGENVFIAAYSNSINGVATDELVKISAPGPDLNPD